MIFLDKTVMGLLYKCDKMYLCMKNIFTVLTIVSVVCFSAVCFAKEYTESIIPRENDGDKYNKTVDGKKYTYHFGSGNNINIQLGDGFIDNAVSLQKDTSVIIDNPIDITISNTEEYKHTILTGVNAFHQGTNNNLKMNGGSITVNAKGIRDASAIYITAPSSTLDLGDIDLKTELSEAKNNASLEGIYLQSYLYNGSNPVSGKVDFTIGNSNIYSNISGGQNVTSYGIRSIGTNGDVTVKGKNLSIQSSATSSSSDNNEVSWAVGIAVETDTANNVVSLESCDIYVISNGNSKAYADGIFGRDKTNPGSLQNSVKIGDINMKIAATGGSIAEARGIRTQRGDSTVKIGKANITVTAEGENKASGYGIMMQSGEKGSVSVGDGSINVSSKAAESAESYGIFVKNVNPYDCSFTKTGGELKVQAEGGNASAYGVWVNSGNVVLDSVDVTAASDTGKVYAFWAANVGSIEAQNANTISGDIGGESGSSIVTSIKDAGRLTGWTSTPSGGTLDLTFGKDAVWNMVSSNTLTPGGEGRYVGNLTNLALNDSHVYVGSSKDTWGNAGFAASQARLKPTDVPTELEVGNLSGSGTFYLRTDLEKDISDSVRVTESLTGSYGLYVKASGKEPVGVQTKSYLARTEKDVPVDGSAFSLKGGKTIDGQHMVDVGLYNYKLDNSERNNGREWYLTRAGSSPTAETVLGLSGMASAYSMWDGQLADLRKRLGEIRYGNGKDGVWARGFTQKNKLDGLGGVDFSQNLYGGSLGYDHLYEPNGDDRWLFGFRAQVSRADQTIKGHYSGSGDNESYGFSGYATWWNADGWYADGVLTCDRYEQDLRTRMLDGTPVTGSYDNYGLGTSIEVGKTMRFDNGAFVEPQMQLSYYWLEGTSFTTSNGMETNPHDADSLTGRAGVVIGKKWAFDDGRFVQPYVKAGVNHEFLGDQKATVNGETFVGELRGTRAYYGAGVDWKVSDGVRLYGEFEREDGHHLSKTWSVSAGLRYEF